MKLFKGCTEGSHKFRARYSAGAPSLNLNSFEEAPAFVIERMYKASKPKTYIHDICVRCGKIIMRNL